MLTSDKNIIGVPFSVFWRINDARSFLFNVADQERTIRTASQSAMREVVGQTRAQAILTHRHANARRGEIRCAETPYHGPGGRDHHLREPGRRAAAARRADAFAEVVRAGQEQQQRINEAEQYRNQQFRLADGEAAKLIEDANAYKASTVAEAQGEASRFLCL